jgi:imidazole glycerol phosphate synthase glutamine amidotransferase subunit
MMRALDANGVLPVLRERIEKRVPFLGICLGLQALFEASEEAPDVKGLGLFPGTVKRFPAGARVPQMGWNQLEVRGEPRLLHGIGSKPYVYFAHSYYAPVVNETAATTTYEVPYTSAVEAGTVFGVQFHPEKSGPTGLRIMRNFLEV